MYNRITDICERIGLWIFTLVGRDSVLCASKVYRKDIL